MNAADIARVFQSDDKDAVLASFAIDAVEPHVANNRIMSAPVLLLRVVVQIDFQYTFATLSNLYITYKDVLYHSPADRNWS